jgi:alkylhydroperoxidase/carboxymuconolactone decarboxylase family protein YurZ
MSSDFTPRSSADTTGRVQQILAHLEEIHRDLPILRLAANSPHTFRYFVNLTAALIERGPLPAADREVVILYLAARARVAYEWSEHVPISAEAGVSDAQRAALEGGTLLDQDRALFSSSQLLAVRFCDELLEETGLTPATRRAGIVHWGDVATLDLILSVGVWGGLVPVLVRGLGLTRTPSAPPPSFLHLAPSVPTS